MPKPWTGEGARGGVSMGAWSAAVIFEDGVDGESGGGELCGGNNDAGTESNGGATKKTGW